MRQFCLLLVCALLAACGGGTPPTTPPTPTAPPSPPAPAPPWALSGQVVNTLNGQPIGNARVDAGTLSATTAADGTFTLSQATPPLSPLQSSIIAATHVERVTVVEWPRGTRELKLDLISLSAPFSLVFYRQLVRDGLESAQLGPVYRWMTRPRVSLYPFDDAGRPLPPEVLATIRAAVPRSVVAWSGGLYDGVTAEETSVPDWQEGWIVLHALRAQASEDCGSAAFRYRGAGRIVTARVELTLDRCSCGSRKISPNTVSHEIAHAMGYWHVQGPHILGPTGSGCSSFENEVITPLESAHAQIAYRRPPGNLDPDRDPDGAMLAVDGSFGHSRLVTCRR